MSKNRQIKWITLGIAFIILKRVISFFVMIPVLILILIYTPSFGAEDIKDYYSISNENISKIEISYYKQYESQDIYEGTVNFYNQKEFDSIINWINGLKIIENDAEIDIFNDYYEMTSYYVEINYNDNSEIFVSYITAWNTILSCEIDNFSVTRKPLNKYIKMAKKVAVMTGANAGSS